MIPIKLSIQGLYSYQEIQEVNFRKLTESNVFGIFGKVGSGKTSLLEAISFALYGETERLNSRDNRPYNMMNLKSKHLLIDFEFQAGPEQHRYKFVYEAKRHPKKHQEIAPGERRLFIWQDTNWHPIGNEKEDVAVLSKQIIGLDYDNFKRTIIIPQNQFREFLELTPRERTEMMNRLFKLDQYDLAGRVGKLSRMNDMYLAELRGLLLPLEIVTPEAIDQRKTTIETIQKALADTIEQLNASEPGEQHLIHLKKQHDSLIWARSEQEQCLTQEPEIRTIEQTIRQFEQCRLLFQADLSALDKLKKRHAELVDSAQKAQIRLANCTTRLPALQQAYKKAKTSYESRESIQKQLDELDTVQAIRTAQNSIDQQTKNQLALDRQSKQYKTQLDTQKAERKKHQTLIDNLFGQESDMERLYKVQNWFDLYKPLKERADTLQEQLSEYDANVARLKQRKDDALVDFPPEWSALTLKTLPSQITQAIVELKTIEQTHESIHQETLVKYELQQYAENLTDGLPCPLCGATHHPTKHSGNTTETDLKKAEEQLQKARLRIEETNLLRLTINGLETELRGVLNNGKRLIQERAEVIHKRMAHEDQFTWTDFSIQQEQAVADALRQAGTHQKRLQDAQKVVRELVRQIEETETELAKISEALAMANNDIAGLKGQLKHQIESLEYYKLADVTGWNLSQIADQRTKLDQQYTKAKADFDEADNQQRNAEKEQAALQEQVQQLTKQTADLTSDIGEQETLVDKNLTDNGLLREQVVQILTSNLNIEQEKERIREYNDKLAGFQKLVTNLETELANQPFDPEALAAIQAQLKLLREQKDTFNKDLGKASNVLSTLEQQWTEKQIHQQRHDELDLRRQDLKKMDELFRAQGFVNYVSAVYLKNLCESANERFFKLTNNQLKLELDEKNNFLVRDYLNGGEVRSVKTLSGGQTFQAALSMALALSDNIQHLTKAKQNLFFLDEGFGTLDKDSLQTVFKTLKALRSENRVVGIISHVEELQQEVDTYIRTEASENGSRIINSWEG